MKKLTLQLLIYGFLFAASISSAFAQSQALNGQIEGTILDQTGAAVPNAVITVTNIETGATRTVTTDESGVYRFPLLSLGTYRIIAEAANFKKLVREGITLATGQTATVDLILPAGEVQEIVTVSLDTSVVDAGKTDLGRVMNTREVQNLPLIPRNPYNFGLLQTNVTGRPSRGFPFPNINANGYLRRVNFLIDGNTNTQGDRGSIRLMLISDTYVSEVQLVTNGFAAEFGNTPGLIMNIVTPAGTNKISGAVSYRFRRPIFFSRPFFYPAADLPDNKTDNFTATIGAPIIKDRWHFYAAYEYVRRDDKAVAARLLTIRPENRADLIAAGLPASIFPAAIPALEIGDFYIFRTDAQLNDKNRLTVRSNYSNTLSDNFIPGGFNTLERSINVSSVSAALAVQLTSFTAQVLNEFRFQYAQRGASRPCRNELSGSGPSIVITQVANFGSPECTDGILPPRRTTQFQDNLTRTFGTHVFKFGGGVNFYNHSEREAVFSRYTFSSIADYIAARNGAPRSYTEYRETFGDPDINYQATFWNFFAQDDWKLTRRLKINYGLRYDLYRIPQAEANPSCQEMTGAQASPLAMSVASTRKIPLQFMMSDVNRYFRAIALIASGDACAPVPFNTRLKVDKNNFAPRLGVVYALREGKRPTIIRFGAGIYYDQPLLAMYQRALQNNGNPRFFNLSFTPTTLNAPDFPNTFLGSLPVGSTLTARQDIDTISPNFETMYAMHFNFQLEQAITENLSFAAGFIHSGGRHIPIYRNINCRPVGETLNDGRPLFGTITETGTITPCTTRIFPQFQNILLVESVGFSRYDALTLQLTKRFSGGLQFSANYTLSKATDDAPEQNMTTGNIQDLVLSDPTNRRLDKGNSFADQRHTFVMSLVARLQVNFENKPLRYLFNHNQVGLIATANSGERFNIISGLDLNRDGVLTSDRPVGIKRNSGKTPPQFNVDLRYSRFFNFTDRYKLEAFGEFQNLFNVNSIVGFTNVRVMTNPTTGEIIGELPDFRARNQSTSQDSRQFQLGFKFIF